MADRDTVLLLSGGLDSAALAVMIRPTLALFVDYGQKPREAESRAARAVAALLNIPFTLVRLPLGDLGGGLMHDDTPMPDAPSPEWWRERPSTCRLSSYRVAWTSITARTSSRLASFCMRWQREPAHLVVDRMRI